MSLHQRGLRCRCKFVPPFVEEAVARSAEGPAAEASAARLTDAARERRAGAIEAAAKGCPRADRHIPPRSV
jgi:hypothetical protein